LVDAILPEVSVCLEGTIAWAFSAEQPLFAVLQLPFVTVLSDLEIVPTVSFLQLSPADVSAQMDVLFASEDAGCEALFREFDVNALKQLIAAVIMRLMILRCIMISFL